MFCIFPGDEADGEGEVTVAPGQVSGQVKLSINYKDDALFIMVRHAKDLVSIKGTNHDSIFQNFIFSTLAHIFAYL